MKVNFGRPEGPPDKCEHNPVCYLWRTKDERTVPVCQLTDQHLENIINKIGNYVPQVAIESLYHEYSRRHDKDFSEIETTTDLIFAFKSVRIQDDPSLGIVLATRDPWPTVDMEATCTRGSNRLRSHLTNEMMMRRDHGSLTGCGLYSFAQRSNAVKYNYGYHRSTAVLMLRLLGVVNDVIYADPNAEGYLSEKARMVRIWIPESAQRNLHPDTMLVLPQKYKIPVSMLPDEEFHRL